MTNLTTAPGLRTRSAWLVVAITWSIVVFDGYDLIVYGTTVPSLMEAFTGAALTAAVLLMITRVATKPASTKPVEAVLVH